MGYRLSTAPFGRPAGHIGGDLRWYCAGLGRGSRQCREGLGQFNPGIYSSGGGDSPMGLPGPGSPMMGPPLPPGVQPPAMPASLFPTNVKEGDVVQVGGPFGGTFQGQVVVRFAGAPGQAIALTSPYGGTVVVPRGAQTGACTVELDGRAIYSADCVVGRSDAAHAPQHRGAAAWREFSTFGPLSGPLDAGEIVHAASFAVLSGAVGYSVPIFGMSRMQTAMVSAATALASHFAFARLREAFRRPTPTAEDLVAKMNASGVKVVPLTGFGVSEHREGYSKYATMAQYKASPPPPSAPPPRAPLLAIPTTAGSVPVVLIALAAGGAALWLYLRRRRKVR